MKFYIKTFGCQMNENDSLLIGSLLNSAGHHACHEAEDADIIIINTCCVRQSAENRALGYIGSIKKLKEQRPELIIVVCGCMMQQEGAAELLRHKYRHVGIIIGTFASALLPAYIQQYAADGRSIVNVEENYEQQQLESCSREVNSYKAQVNINFGCNNFCSYCIVPYVRGRERSRDPRSIISEISALAQSGVKEVQLLGQNVNSYGKDDPTLGWDLARLLRAVHEIEGIQRIRFMTSHPRDFDENLAAAIAALPKLCRHIHLPVQSGSDRLLQLMNRGYTTAEYLEKLACIRRLMPDAAVTSDIIVGFPGETEEDLQQTLAFLREAQFDTAYTFIYSRRSGTRAAEMSGHLDEATKKERLQRLMAVQDPISLAKNQQLVGSLQWVMAEGISKNCGAMMSGRTGGNKIVNFPAVSGVLPGDTLELKINEAQTWSLMGEHKRDID